MWKLDAEGRVKKQRSRGAGEQRRKTTPLAVVALNQGSEGARELSRHLRARL